MYKRQKQKASAKRSTEKSDNIPKEPEQFKVWLAKAFQQEEIEPVPVSLTYTMAVIIVGFVMLMLPVAYVSLIAGIAVGTCLRPRGAWRRPGRSPEQC